MPERLSWYIPSFYGDVRLERRGEKTALVPERLSEDEKVVMRAVLKEAARTGLRKKPWWDGDADLAIKKELEVVLDAPIDKVARALSKAMKPGRKVLSVVKMRDGHLEEVTEATAERVASPEARAATSVAAPVRGCPAPVFDPFEVRARRVLRAFLTDQQVEDFEREQAFVATGLATGHRYAVTSRSAPAALARAGGRSLYDLDERRAYCVHDWDVPPAEEMLGIAVFLQVPGGERYLRDVPDDGRDHEEHMPVGLLRDVYGRPIQG